MLLTVRDLPEKINITEGRNALFRFNEPLSAHTTFRVGGPADLWLQPIGPEAELVLIRALAACREAGIPVCVLGGGANVVFSDLGFRGVVLDSGGLVGCEFSQDEGGPRVYARAGTSVDEAARACAERAFGGLDFLAAMPGSVGGAVWMNARCYGSSVSDVLLETVILNEAGERELCPFVASDFSYKRSPFQTRKVLILGASFRLRAADQAALSARMAEIRADREAKGHFRLPSAGSAFKNDYGFGKPTGQIVDELGLRGLAVGGARVAEWHGNIIVNGGGASALDIRRLTVELARRVHAALGLVLEPEILVLGDWSKWPEFLEN